MNILAIETSCEHASVALLAGHELIEHRLEGHSNHSERLLPTIAALLAEAGLGLTSLDAIAFGSGPGAFTGLRLACGVAQGLAMGAGVGVAPVSSLAALALQGGAGNVFVATDARMGEIYSAAYRVRGDAVVEVRSPRCTPPAELALPPDGEWIALGAALGTYAASIPPELLARLSRSDVTAVPRAGEIARLAVAPTESGRLVAAECALPLYVRDKVALTTQERLSRGGRA